MDFMFWLQLIATLGITLTGVWFGKRLDRKEKMREKREQQREAETRLFRDRVEATGLGLQSLLRNSIIGLHRECIRNGRKKTYYDIQNMERMYEAYHALGGNGMVTEIYEDFKKFELAED